MATGGSLQVGVKDSETAGSSPMSSSPDYTHAQEHLELQLSELIAARASPRLSRKALDELGQENENTDDPDNYPLYSPWTFWFDRSEMVKSRVVWGLAELLVKMADQSMVYPNMVCLNHHTTVAEQSGGHSHNGISANYLRLRGHMAGN